MNNKRWIYNRFDQDTVNKISQEFKISPLVATIVLNRRIKEAEDIKYFLKRDITTIYDAFLMKDMEKAVNRIQQAIQEKEKITIYGDYDVDGITSTSIMVRYLMSCGAIVDYYIPDRIDEGYGVNKRALDKIKSRGTKLIITVDSGITAVEEIDYAYSLGLDIIVTDHHECKEEIPRALAVINPKQKDCSYPFKELAGVGVAFKLIQALDGQQNILKLIDEYCDIVCLGTVADVVPLVGENRLIVYEGLKRIQNTKNIGLKALIEVSGLKGKKISSGHVGYTIAPRINAAGRIGSALRAVGLFLTEEPVVAKEIACELNEENRNRQATESHILQDALQIVEEDENISRRKVLVLANENWHHGVIGIVASRITDKFYKPSILISLEGNEGKGSGRSIKGFNLFAALVECREELKKFGGHELAAGLNIARENIPAFLEHINIYADQCLDSEDLVPPVYIDCTIDVQQLTIDTISQLEVLEPFGMGNAAPVFALCSAKIIDIRTVGDDKHIKISLKKDSVFIDAIGFNMGEFIEQLTIGDTVDVACSLDINTYNGREKVQLILKDIKLNDLEFNRYRYYHSFYSLLENDIISKNEVNVCNHNYNIEEYNVEKCDLVDICNQLDMGHKCLVIIHTLKGMYECDQYLYTLDRQIYKYKIYFGAIEQPEVFDIVINPVKNGVDFNQYDTVYIYDPCLTEDRFEELLEKCNQSCIYILLNDKKFDWCRQVWDAVIPERRDFVMIYQYIKTRSMNGLYRDSIQLLYRKIAVSYNTNMNYMLLMNCLNVFEELGLLSVKTEGDQVEVFLLDHQGEKINIEGSSRFANLRKMRDKLEEFRIMLSKRAIAKYIEEREL